MNPNAEVERQPRAGSAALRPQKRRWFGNLPSALFLPGLLRRERRAPPTLRASVALPTLATAAAGQGWIRWGLLLLLGLAVLTSACRTGQPLPKADFSAPGWQVRQGQAVWRRAGAAELSGELLVATHTDGSAVVQFAKPPVTLVTAQSTKEKWAVRFLPNNSFSGPGAPPTRVIWLNLPRFLGGAAPSSNWLWESPDRESWRLENRRTGESLEGYLTP